MRARVSLYTRCTSTKLLYSCITPYVVFALHRSSTKRSRYDYILENVDSQQFWIRGYGRERETRFWRNAKIAKYRRGIPSSCERIADGCRRPTGPVPPSSLHPLASLHPAASCVTSLPTLDPPSLQRLPLLQRYHLHPPSLSPPRSPLESARLHSVLRPSLSLFLPSTATLLNRSRVHRRNSPVFLLNFIVPVITIIIRDWFQQSRISRFVNFRISDGARVRLFFSRYFFFFTRIISSLFISNMVGYYENGKDRCFESRDNVRAP